MPSSSGVACLPITRVTTALPSRRLRDKPGVSEALHQHHQGTGDAVEIPAGAGRICRRTRSRAARESPDRTRPQRSRPYAVGLRNRLDDLQWLAGSTCSMQRSSSEADPATSHNGYMPASTIDGSHAKQSCCPPPCSSAWPPLGRDSAGPSWVSLCLTLRFNVARSFCRPAAAANRMRKDSPLTC